MIKLSELVRIIINEYIEHKDLLSIEEEEVDVEGQMTTIIKVHTTNRGDTGKVIGKLLVHNFELIKSCEFGEHLRFNFKTIPSQA